jgi:hypothetical protein
MPKTELLNNSVPAVGDAGVLCRREEGEANLSRHSSRILDQFFSIGLHIRVGKGKEKLSMWSLPMGSGSAAQNAEGTRHHHSAAGRCASDSIIFGFNY